MVAICCLERGRSAQQRRAEAKRAEDARAMSSSMSCPAGEWNMRGFGTAEPLFGLSE